MNDPIWEFSGVSKSFCGVSVLSDISLKLYPGKTHGLLGCNGAGKSTLVRILSGEIQPDTGTILIDGHPIAFKSPRDAIRAGVAISTQELTLFPEMTIADNLFVKTMPIRGCIRMHYAAINAETKKILARLHINASPDRKVSELSQGEKYLIQFARCWLNTPHLLVLDELSASLTYSELNIVHSMMMELKHCGTTILYITHRMKDILSVSDYLTILRDGKVTMEPDIRTITPKNLRSHIFGETTNKLYPKLPSRLGENILEVSHIGNMYIQNVSFSLRRGEVLGILGIAGSGRTRLLRAVSGADALHCGSIRYDGRQITVKLNRLFSNIAYIPEDRDARALFSNFDCNKNITIRNLEKISTYNVLRLQDESISCRNTINRLGINAVCLDRSVRYLSGGNKQKVVIARYLYSKCSVYLFDEPTQGVDTVGKVDIYNIINELARKGAGIVFVSSDYAELLGMCDKILIMHQGSVVAQCTAQEISENAILDSFIE